MLHHISVATTRGEKADILQEMASTDGPVVVSFINAHGANLAWSDPAFREAILGSDVLLRDGVGMSMLMRMLHEDPGLNLNGTDLIPEFLRTYADRRIALAGTTSPYVEQAASRLRSLYGCNVIATIDGFRTDDTYASWAREAEPDIIVLGMGMPKQERVAMILRAELTHPCLIFNGGAVLDFLAERVVRAPRWVRALHEEWLYRLVHEPRRLWRRYVLGNPLFVLHALRLRVWSRRHPESAGLDAEVHHPGSPAAGGLVPRDVPHGPGEPDQEERQS